MTTMGTRMRYANRRYDRHQFWAEIVNGLEISRILRWFLLLGGGYLIACLLFSLLALWSAVSGEVPGQYVPWLHWPLDVVASL